MIAKYIAWVPQFDELMRTHNGTLYALRLDFVLFLLPVLVVTEFVMMAPFAIFGAEFGLGVLLNFGAGVLGFGLWRVGVFERRLDRAQVFPAVNFYKFGYLMIIGTLICAMTLLNFFFVSMWFYVLLLVVIILVSAEMHVTLRDGYDDAGSTRYIALLPALKACGFFVLFGLIYGACFLLSEGLGRRSVWDNLFGFIPTSISDFLATAFGYAFVLLYLAETIFLLRSLALVGRYCVAVTASKPAEFLIEFQSKVIAALVVSFGIISHWTIESASFGGDVVGLLLVSVCFIISGVAINWVLLTGQTLVLGPRN